MPAARKLPDMGTLLRWRGEGLTHQAIAERWFQQTGIIVSRSTISAALHRAGKTATMPRYDECLPWRVRTVHLKETPARMLRFLGATREGRRLAARDKRALDNWLRRLDESKLVVGYDPDNEQQGFHYVPRRGSEGRNGIPIRRQPLRRRVADLPQ